MGDAGVVGAACTPVYGRFARTVCLPMPIVIAGAYIGVGPSGELDACLAPAELALCLGSGIIGDAEWAFYKIFTNPPSFSRCPSW